VRFAYFPGCAAANRRSELDAATRAVARELGIELVALPPAACCGAGDHRTYDAATSLAADARTLSLAAEHGATLVTVCGTCQFHLSRSARALEDPATRARANEALAADGRRYEGGMAVRHLVQVLLQDVGPRKLQAHVCRPLQDVAVGAFYGCNLVRAAGAESFDDPADPRALERIITLLGGRPVAYGSRTACCGFPLLATHEGAALRMAGDGLRAARAAGAVAVATPCPLCASVLDGDQGRAERAAGARIRMPVLHVSQIVGLAFGLAPEALGVRRHAVPVRPLVDAVAAEEVVRP